MSVRRGPSVNGLRIVGHVLQNFGHSVDVRIDDAGVAAAEAVHIEAAAGGCRRHTTPPYAAAACGGDLSSSLLASAS